MDIMDSLILLVMIRTFGILSQNSVWRCTTRVSSCPITEELWNQKIKYVPCLREGLNYTCMMATDGALVEACINEYEIRAYTGRCPFIHSCDGIEPVLAIEDQWKICPEEVIGCPPSNHPAYTVYQMYKYPACIVHNVTELIDKTLPGDITSLPSYTVVGYNTTTNDTVSPATDRTTTGIITGVIIGVVGVVSFLAVTIIVYIWRKNRKRKVKERDNDDNNKGHMLTLDSHENVSEPLLNESSMMNKSVDDTYEKSSLHQSQPETNATSTIHADQGFFDSLKKSLVDISKRVTENIPMSPVQTFGNLPVELLYAKVVIQTHSRYVRMGREYFDNSNTEKEQKIIKHPNDLFYKYGEPAKRIFMIGNAAHGKTTYCLWLLQHWYNTNIKREGKKPKDEWGKVVGQFDFVFLIRLRDVVQSTATVIDMICKDILQIDDKECINWFKMKLRAGEYRSLILIDGLDEWKPDTSVTEDRRFKGLPIIDGIENFVILITMRNWKFEEVSEQVDPRDRVVEILGLDDNGIRSVTDNVLHNHHGLNIETPADKLKYDEIMNKLKEKTLNSLMKIPLLAVLCVQIWYNGEEIGNSLTSFYSAMINMLIYRAKSPLETERKLKSTSHMPTSYNKWKPDLSKLGKIAYQGIINGRYKFDFLTEEMLQELDLTNEELEFFLNVGLLSREEADSTMQKKVQLYFFHTSVQEYFCAIYVSNNEELRMSFLERLSTIKVILEFGNVLIFLSGLDPSLGCEISKHIVSVANADTAINEYRKFNMAFLFRDVSIHLLYNLQASCYRELTYTQSRSGSLAVPYHITDVYVDDESDTETIMATADILIHHNADIRSLFIFGVPTDVDNGIPDSILTQYLDNTVSLQSLWIDGYNTQRTLHHISDIFSSLTALALYHITLSSDTISILQSVLQSNTVIQTLGLRNIKTQDNKDEGHKPASLSGIIQILPDLPRLSTLRIRITHKDDKPVLLEVLSCLSHLHGIRYYGTYPCDDEYDHDIVQTLCTWLGLRWLGMSYVNLGAQGLRLPHDMLHLEAVILFEVDMLPSGMKGFIQSVLNISHKLDAFLFKRNIDEECLTLIRSSPHLRITCDVVHDDGIQQLSFTRVWSPSE